jgi:hypothetical protein
MNGNLSSLKILDLDDNICFNSISNVSNLDSIHTLNFILYNLENIKYFSKLCRLCSNLVELSLTADILHGPQALIDEFLNPALPTLFKLKTLKITLYNDSDALRIIYLTKFTQIEELELTLFTFHLLLSKIKFDNCKSLKRVKINISNIEMVDMLLIMLNTYEGWNFNYKDCTFFGNKV